jgi:hypothetical protein
MSMSTKTRRANLVLEILEERTVLTAVGRPLSAGGLLQAPAAKVSASVFTYQLGSWGGAPNSDSGLASGLNSAAVPTKVLKGSAAYLGNAVNPPSASYGVGGDSLPAAGVPAATGGSAGGGQTSDLIGTDARLRKQDAGGEKRAKADVIAGLAGTEKRARTREANTQGVADTNGPPPGMTSTRVPFDDNRPLGALYEALAEMDALSEGMSKGRNSQPSAPPSRLPLPSDVENDDSGQGADQSRQKYQELKSALSAFVDLLHGFLGKTTDLP